MAARHSKQCLRRPSRRLSPNHEQCTEEPQEAHRNSQWESPLQTLDLPLRRVVPGRPCQVLQARGCLTAHRKKSVEALDLLESHFGKNHALSTISALDAVSQALSSRESAPRRKAVMEAKAALATGRLKARQGQLIGNTMTPAMGRSRGF